MPSGVLPVVCHACNLYKETVPTRLEKVIAYCGKVIAEFPGLMDTPSCEVSENYTCQILYRYEPSLYPLSQT